MDQFELGDEAKRVADSGRYADAAKLYREVADLIPIDDVEGRVIHYLLAARAHEEAGNYEDAINDCQFATTLAPNSHMAWRGLGQSLSDAGRLAEAESALQKSLALRATKITCMFLAVVYLKGENFIDAERYCRQAISLDPACEEAYYNLGDALSEQGRAEEALQAFETAYTLDPQYAGPHREAGKLLLDLGRYAEAETHLQKALVLAPNDERGIELMRRVIKKLR